MLVGPLFAVGMHPSSVTAPAGVMRASLFGEVLGEPQVAVGAGDDAVHAAGGRRDAELRDHAGGGDAVRSRLTRVGEPQVAVGAHRDVVQVAAGRDRELAGDLVARLVGLYATHKRGAVAVRCDEPDVAVRSRHQGARRGRDIDQRARRRVAKHDVAEAGRAARPHVVVRSQGDRPARRAQELGHDERTRRADGRDRRQIVVRGRVAGEPQVAVRARHDVVDEHGSVRGAASVRNEATAPVDGTMRATAPMPASPRSR